MHLVERGQSFEKVPIEIRGAKARGEFEPLGGPTWDEARGFPQCRRERLKLSSIRFLQFLQACHGRPEINSGWARSGAPHRSSAE